MWVLKSFTVSWDEVFDEKSLANWRTSLVSIVDKWDLILVGLFAILTFLNSKFTVLNVFLEDWKKHVVHNKTTVKSKTAWNMKIILNNSTTISLHWQTFHRLKWYFIELSNHNETLMSSSDSKLLTFSPARSFQYAFFKGAEQQQRWSLSYKEKNKKHSRPVLMTIKKEKKIDEKCLMHEVHKYSFFIGRSQSLFCC